MYFYRNTCATATGVTAWLPHLAVVLKPFQIKNHTAASMQSHPKGEGPVFCNLREEQIKVSVDCLEVEEMLYEGIYTSLN